MTARAGRRRPLVVAIDGPAGAGKSTVAKGVARALGIAHLDTGAMYRALTAKALSQSLDPADERALARLARRTTMTFDRRGLLVDGRRVGRAIRGQAVNRWVSVVAAHAEVRRELVRMQRHIMDGTDIVAEGRDIGTVVYPDATLKVFLTASRAERARRRHEELTAAGEQVALRTLTREIARRDRLDSTRATGPLVAAPDAVRLDSTRLSAAEVIERIVSLARERAGELTPARGGTRR